MKFFLILLLLPLFSCKNYYNEMIDWTSSIPMEVSIDSVKQIQPDFIEIDWNNPDTTFNNETRYFITKIKYDHDILNMNNYLVFVDGKYQGRFAHK